MSPYQAAKAIMHCTYCKYFVVGSIVGIIAIVSREIIGVMLPSDTPAYYLLSVILVYAGGIVASFYAHYLITFSHICNKRTAIKSISKFVIIAVIGMIVTSALSYQIRYHFGLQDAFRAFLPAFAFGTATVVASLVTYNLNKRYTFIASAALAETAYRDNPKEQQWQ